MAQTSYNLQKINLLSNAQYNEIETPDDNNLYAIEGHFVVEFQVTATGGYRKFSDGYIEQWGIKGAGTEVELYVPMGTSTYHIDLTLMEETSTVPYYSEQTVNGFKTISASLSWKVSGY